MLVRSGPQRAAACCPVWAAGRNAAGNAALGTSPRWRKLVGSTIYSCSIQPVITGAQSNVLTSSSDYTAGVPVSSKLLSSLRATTGPTTRRRIDDGYAEAGGE